jgi:hypothetical protein
MCSGGPWISELFSLGVSFSDVQPPPLGPRFPSSEHQFGSPGRRRLSAVAKRELSTVRSLLVLSYPRRQLTTGSPPPPVPDQSKPAYSVPPPTMCTDSPVPDVRSPRPAPWLPLVFSSVDQAAESSICGVSAYDLRVVSSKILFCKNTVSDYSMPHRTVHPWQEPLRQTA